MSVEKPFDPQFGNYLLHGITEIQLPQAVPWWPQTLAWKLLFLLLLLWLCYQVVNAYRRWHANRYRRIALKQLQQIDLEEGTEETTGWKTITVYDIDTQAMNLIEICQIEAKVVNNSEKEIYTYLENNNDETEYNLIQL